MTRRPEGPPPDNRRLWLAVAAGMGAILVVVLLIERSRAPAEPPARGPGPGLSIAVPMTPESGSRLSPPPKERDAGAEALAFDEFIQLMDGMKSDPLAAEFAKEFMKEPELQRIAQEFRDPRRGRGHATGSMQEFYRAISQLPEFRRLVAKFAAAPGSAGLMAKLSLIPGLTQLVRAEHAALAASRSGLRSAVGPRSGTRGADPAALRAGAGPSAGVQYAGSLLPEAGAGAPAAHNLGGQPIDLGREGGHARGRSGESQQGPDAHLTTPLEAIGGSGPSFSRDSFMSLCVKQAGITRAECGAINSYLGPHGIWESCWRADLYDKCVDLCAGVPELKCSGTAPGWVQACVDWNPGDAGRQAVCASQCADLGRPDCPAGAGPAPTAPTPASGGTYTIKPGDTMTKIVMAVYGITDPRTAYLTALELYRYGENRKASGRNPYNPNLIFPGKVLTLPPLPELKNMVIDKS